MLGEMNVTLVASVPAGTGPPAGSDPPPEDPPPGTGGTCAWVEVEVVRDVEVVDVEEVGPVWSEVVPPQAARLSIPMRASPARSEVVHRRILGASIPPPPAGRSVAFTTSKRNRPIWPV
jgi:hypothetical protein